jgi:hypothetical protein
VKQLGIECIDDVIQYVVARDAMGEWQEAAQELQMDPTPAADFDEILGACEAAAEHQKQDLRQWLDHFPGLPRVLQGRKLFDQGCARCNRHARLLAMGGAEESHRAVTGESPRLVKPALQAIAVLIGLCPEGRRAG